MCGQKKIIIVGAGLAGLCTAYYLIKKGFSVEVVDKNTSVALGASYANGGLLTPSMSEPWNSPGILFQLLKYLGDSGAPMLLKPRYLHNYIRWGMKFLANSNKRQFNHSTIQNMKLSMYSMSKLHELRESLGLEYESKREGTLKIFRQKKSFEQAIKHSSMLTEKGLKLEILSPKEVEKVEPILNEVSSTLCGGIFYPEDEIGNAKLFCEQLSEHIIRLGGKISLNTNVQKIIINSGTVNGVLTDKGSIDCSKVVVAGGAWTSDLLKNIGISLSIKPVKGYSLSVPMNNEITLPTKAILDDDLHAAITPLGSSIRLAGTAEFSGWNDDIDSKRIDNLWNFFRTITPKLYEQSRVESAEQWCGFRPMSADGLPYLGRTFIEGVYVNSGHGPLGWSQAAGSAHLISQVVAGCPTSIDIDSFAVR